MKILSKNASDTETKDTCNNDKYHTPEQALKILLGYDSFRAGQKSVIDSILAGSDAFAVICRESHWWFRRLFHLCRIRSKH